MNQINYLYSNMDNVTYNDIIEFLNYETEFYEYIKDKILFLNDEIEDPEEMYYQVLIKENELNEIIGMKIIIPRVTNLKTALIVVHELKHAHDIYLNIGNSSNIDIEEYEKAAKSIENKFVKSLHKKTHH